MSEQTAAEKYQAFGRRVLDAFSEDLTDIDGGHLHDMAVNCGVLVKHIASAPCAPEDVCRCREYETTYLDDFGAEWFSIPLECYRRVQE